MPNESHNSENYQLWGGRFESENDDLMKMFNTSLPIDKRLWKEDILVFCLVYYELI